MYTRDIASLPSEQEAALKGQKKKGRLSGLAIRRDINEGGNTS